MTRSDAVRRLALDELLARYRPPGRGPTLSPPREGAPGQWHAVAAILDPLSPEQRVARVLQVYDGLDDPSDHQPAPPVDIGLAELFADAVADVSPASRLTELITNRDVDDPMDGLGRAVPARRQWSMPARGRRWLGGAVAAFAVVVRAGQRGLRRGRPLGPGSGGGGRSRHDRRAGGRDLPRSRRSRAAPRPTRRSARVARRCRRRARPSPAGWRGSSPRTGTPSSRCIGVAATRRSSTATGASVGRDRTASGGSATSTAARTTRSRS